KGMKWQISDDYLEEFVAKVHRTMTPRPSKQKVIAPSTTPTTTTSNQQQSPLRMRYPSSSTTATECTPLRHQPLQLSPNSNEYMMSSPSSVLGPAALPPSQQPPVESATPERASQR